MLSLDQLARSKRSSASKWLLAGAVLLGLSGCQVRPLYGSLDSQYSGSTVSADLAAIRVEPINSKYANTDTVRVLYNDLVYNFERGAERPEKRYRLEVLVNLISAEVSVEELQDVPAAYATTLTATFVLSELKTNTTLYTGKSFATASYDFSDQRFANKRASRNAQERAAKVVADDIQARLAGFFAEQVTQGES
ncbi:hypothetical protein [Roseibium sp. RKSG952]|uniref:hypothetical protein n=1 Tax=Roseibium sp. RKSG952 TaxID=2529384 RepID=UPI0012BC56F0|nr:hypothetical protein [Roseibium sp. RKSG952]MTI01085.1 hypothetical protein [Roseibium sp. RKSG952]